MGGFWRAILLVLVMVSAGPVRGQGSGTIALPDGVDLDTAGQSLRRALNAWEGAAGQSGFATWTRVTVARGAGLRLGHDTFFMLLEGAHSESARVMFVGPDGPVNATVFKGREAAVGPLRVIYLFASFSGDTAEFLLKDAETAPTAFLSDTPANSTTRIRGFEDPPRLVVQSSNARALSFARDFVGELGKRKSAEEAAELAWRLNPPPTPAPAVRAMQEQDYTDPTNILDDLENDQPFAVAVDLNLVRGDESLLAQILSEYDYNSAGRVPENPRVSASSDAEGGAVDIGSPGDRFRARLRALERTGRVHTDSSTLVRVPLNGYADFNLSMAGSGVSARLYAQRSGRQHVVLDIDNQSGDWGTVGSVTTRVRARDGQTLAIARNTMRRTTSSSSGVPIASDLPYIGVLFGNSRRTEEGSTYALFATVTIE